MPSFIEKFLKTFSPPGQTKPSAMENTPTDPVTSDRWNEVIALANKMQETIEGFTGNLQQSVNGLHGGSQAAKDLELTLTKLNEVASAVGTFTQSFSQDVQPLINSLITESSEDKAAEIVQNISTAQNQIFKTMADAVTKGANSGLSTASPAGDPDKDKQTADDARKIKEGFEDILKGKDDPRVGMGKIPHPAPPAAKTIAEISDKDTKTADDAQKIKEGFEDILQGKDDPRIDLGRIPRKNPATETADAGTASGKPLSPDAQAIKDGFDEMLNGKDDPRMGFGRIPKSAGIAQDPPRTDIL